MVPMKFYDSEQTDWFSIKIVIHFKAMETPWPGKGF